MTAKPMKTLELRYQMIQFLIKVNIYIKKGAFLLKFEHLLITKQYPAN